MRILAVAEHWWGSDAYAYVRAFRRNGHSVHAVSDTDYLPGHWRRLTLRALARLCEPIFVREYTDGLVQAAERLRPHLFFVFKGTYVTADAVNSIRSLGAVVVNFYPDVSFMAHGKYIPKALPCYDWIFTTKTFGIKDMERSLNIRNASFLPHGYDPEVHRPIDLEAEEHARYDCDVSFIGTWSPKKQEVLEAVCKALPDINIRIWGDQWSPAQAVLGARIQGHEIIGLEYSKAIIASRINLCILSEIREGASSGDLITARTFQIPATGAFMLHERTSEFLEYFVEDKECGCFESAEELIAKIRYYLTRSKERDAIAAAGRRRAIDSGYSVDRLSQKVLEKVNDLRCNGNSAL
jgi:spore maturation protein CgeB